MGGVWSSTSTSQDTGPSVVLVVVVRPRALVSPRPGMCAQLVQPPPPLAALLQRVKVKCSQPRQTLPSPAQPSPAQPSPG